MSLTGGVLLWRDVGAVRGALETAQQELELGRDALSDRDPDRARGHLRAALAAVEGTTSRLDGPGWALVGLVPPLADTPELVGGAVDLAVAGAELGLAATDSAEGLLTGRALDGLLREGRIDLDRIAELGRTIEELPVAPVRAANDRLAGTRAGAVPPSIRDDRDAALDLADELLTTIDNAEKAITSLDEFLGGRGSRTYVVAAQNPSELRGTGGLIGFLTEITFRDGTIAFGDGQSFDADEALLQRTQAEGPRSLEPPVDRSPEFADRYDHVAGGQFLGSVNLDPDLPTVGPVLTALYEQEYDRTVDGAILVDPIALGELVAATGRPLELPQELDTAGLPHQFGGNRIPALTMVDGYDAFEGGGPGKKAFDRAVIGAALERLVTESWDGEVLLRTLQDLFGRRHLQMYSETPTTQELLAEVGIGGAMPVDDEADLLAVTAANAAPNKADVHVSHQITATIELDVDMTRRDRLRRAATIEIGVDNPLEPGDHDEYITGSSPSVPFGSGAPPRAGDALVRTWFSVWFPDSTRLTALRDGINEQVLRQDSIHGHRAVDYFLETPSAAGTSFSFPVAGSVPVATDGEFTEYRLRLWRQAKAIPDLWDLTIAPPPGWEVAAAELDGGGRPIGMGPAGDGAQPLRVAHGPNEARISGAATQDVLIRVQLARR